MRNHASFIAAMLCASLFVTFAEAATTISTDINTGGTLTVAGLSMLNGGASSTQMTLSGQVGVGPYLKIGNTATTSILGDGGTSTFTNGINLASGCFAIGNTCISSSTGSGTVNSGTIGQFAYYASSGTTVSGTSSLTVLASTGAVGIGTTTPGASALFGVAGGAYISGTITAPGNSILGSIIATGNTTLGGQLQVQATTTLNGGTTTGSNGFNISGGCFAISGNCISGGGLSGSGYLGAMAYWSGGSTFSATTAPTVAYMTGTTSATSTFVGGIQVGTGGLYASNGGLRVQSLVNCDTVDTDSTGSFRCGTDALGGGNEINWTYQSPDTNGLVRLSTSSLQLLVGSAATSSRAKLEIAAVSPHPAAYFSGTTTIGATSPWARLTVAGAFGDRVSYLFDIATTTSAAGATSSIFKIHPSGTIMFGGGTTSMASGIDISSGCFAFAGTCISTSTGGGVNLGTINSWTMPQHFVSAYVAGGGVGLDATTTGMLNLGTVSATGVTIGKTTSTTTVPGTLLANKVAFQTSSTTISDMIFGTCTITGATITLASSRNFACATASAVSSSYKIFIQSYGDLAPDFIVQAASTTGASSISMQINNTSTTTSYSPGNAVFNYFGIR